MINGFVLMANTVVIKYFLPDGSWWPMGSNPDNRNDNDQLLRVMLHHVSVHVMMVGAKDSRNFRLQVGKIIQLQL